MKYFALFFLLLFAHNAFAQGCSEVDGGNVVLCGGTTDQSNYLNLQVATNSSGGILGQFPGTLGSSGQALITDGAGHWSWSTPLDGSTFLLKNPATTARNTAQGSASGVVPLSLEAFASGTSHLLDFQNSSGSVYSYFDHYAALFLKPTTDEIALRVQTTSAGTSPLQTWELDNGSSIAVKATMDYTGALTLGVPLAITSGGTGQATANDAFNALAPSQATNSGKFLKTDGTNTSWSTASGGVTSVGLSLPAEFTVSGTPVTTTGTLTGVWASQTANKVFASPNGSSGTPAFRALVASDLPSLSASYIQNQTSSQSSASFNITNNVATTAQATSTYTAGTATALTLTANTSSSFANQGLTFNVANGAPNNDIVGTSSNWSITSAGALTLGTPLTVANGGTGLATLTAHDVQVGNGASSPTQVAPSTGGFVLTSNGASSDPSFQAIPTVLTAVGIYGDASDGAAAFDGTNTFSFATKSGSTYTLTRAIYCTTVTTSSSAVVKTAGFQIFATISVTNGSGCTISCDGIAAVAGLSGGGAAVSGAFPASGVGANGPSTISAGAGGGAMTFAYGGAGGNGGSDGHAHAGGAGGAITAPTAGSGSIHAFPMMFAGAAFNGNGLTFWRSGGGGGSGGNNLSGGSISGNGGGGAGFLAIYSAAITNSGSMHATGGNGATSAQTATDTGGGGGGGGGVVIFVTNAFSGTAPTFAGGTHGNKTGIGSDGVDGSSGQEFLILNQ